MPEQQGTLIFSPEEKARLRQQLPRALVDHAMDRATARLMPDLLAAIEEATTFEGCRVAREVLVDKMVVSLTKFKLVLKAARRWGFVRVCSESGEVNRYETFYERVRMIVQAQLANDRESDDGEVQAQLATLFQNRSQSGAREFHDDPPAPQLFALAPAPAPSRQAPTPRPEGPPGSAQIGPGSAQIGPGSAQIGPGSARSMRAHAPARNGFYGSNGKDGTNGFYKDAFYKSHSCHSAISPWRAIWQRDEPITEATLLDAGEVEKLFGFARRRWKLHEIHRLRFFTLAHSVARRFLYGPDDGQQPIESPGAAFTGALKRRAWYGSLTDEDWARAAILKLSVAQELPPAAAETKEPGTYRDDTAAPDSQVAIDKLLEWDRNRRRDAGQ